MINLFDITGKTAIVTGGARGLGKCMAEGLRDHGCKVALLDINPNVQEIAGQMCTGTENVIGIKCDLTDEADMKSGFDMAVKKLRGKLDILVNNAGINLRKNLAECTKAEWDLVMQINSTAPFLMTKYAADVMKCQKSGKIINVASLLSFLGAVGNGSYAASKSSLLSQTRSFSNELSSFGINVNAMAPGYFITELNTPEKMAVLGEDFLKSIDLRIPMGRWGVAEDLIGTVVYLASSASDYLTGACIPIDGGFLSR